MGGGGCCFAYFRGPGRALFTLCGRVVCCVGLFFVGVVFVVVFCVVLLRFGLFVLRFFGACFVGLECRIPWGCRYVWPQVRRGFRALCFVRQGHGGRLSETLAAPLQRLVLQKKRQGPSAGGEDDWVAVKELTLSYHIMDIQ